MIKHVVVRTDPAAAYPQLAALRSAVEAGDWPRARAILDAASPVERTELIRAAGVARSKRTGDLLGRALAAVPGDGSAAAMLGFYLIDAGWQIRGNDTANAVGRRQFARFHDKLREAEQVLFPATDHNPYDPALWTARLTVARGLQLGPDEAYRRYQRLAEIDPHHLPAQSQLLQQLCPKWGGTWEQVFGFAHDRARAAPEGAPNPVLVADAHLEHWLATAGDGRIRPTGDVLAAAQRSIFHPAYRREVGWVSTLNTFAMAFSLLGDRESARRAFTMLDGHASRFPWAYLGDPAPSFRRNRALAFGWSGPAVVDRVMMVMFRPNTQLLEALRLTRRTG